MDIPLLYILKRGLPPEQAEVVWAALSITPCLAAFVSNAQDAALASNFVTYVVRSESDSSAIHEATECAKEYERPMLVIGEADFLDGMFADGRREPIATYAN